VSSIVLTEEDAKAGVPDPTSLLRASKDAAGIEPMTCRLGIYRFKPIFTMLDRIPIQRTKKS